MVFSENKKHKRETQVPFSGVDPRVVADRKNLPRKKLEWDKKQPTGKLADSVDHKVKRSSGSKPRSTAPSTTATSRQTKSNASAQTCLPLSGYYMKPLRHYLSFSEPIDEFSSIFKDHIQLSFNSVRFSKSIEQDLMDDFVAKHSLNLPRSPRYIGRL